MKYRLAASLLLLSVFSIPLSCTDLCGSVSGSLTAAGNPYIVTCDITVPSGESLTIEEGTELRFDMNYGLYVDGVLKFLQQYQVEFNRTRAFCKKLKDLNLLEPMQAQINLDSGEKRLLTGFSAISRR